MVLTPSAVSKQVRTLEERREAVIARKGLKEVRETPLLGVADRLERRRPQPDLLVLGAHPPGLARRPASQRP